MWRQRVSFLTVRMVLNHMSDAITDSDVMFVKHPCINCMNDEIRLIVVIYVNFEMKGHLSLSLN